MSNFGYESQGGSWVNMAASYGVRACKFTLPEAGVISSISMFIGKDGGDGSYAFALYDSSLNLLAVTGTALLSGTYAFYTLNLTSPYSAAAGDYYLAAWTSGAATYGAYAEGSSGQLQSDNTVPGFDTWPDPIVPTSNDMEKLSIYATYTLGGAALLKIINE